MRPQPVYPPIEEHQSDMEVSDTDEEVRREENNESEYGGPCNDPYCIFICYTLLVSVTFGFWGMGIPFLLSNLVGGIYILLILSIKRKQIREKREASNENKNGEVEYVNKIEIEHTEISI